jgi:hypothetical protein
LRHFLPNDLSLLKDIIQDIITTLASLPKRCTKTLIAKLNLEVASWTTTCKGTTAGTSFVFEDNIGEDKLSSQWTYKVNIHCLYCKASIAPNQKVLNDLKPSIEQLEKVYEGIVKEVNDLRLQIASKSTLSANDCQGKTFNTNSAKVQAKNEFFLPLDDIELVDWTYTNKFARFWFCEDLHHSSILKQAIEKAIQKSTNANLSSKLFQDDSNDEKNQCVGFVSSHKKGTLLTSFHIHSFVVFHTDLQKKTIVTCIFTAQNHIISNMQDRLLQLMQLIQYHHVSLFSTVITNHFIGGYFNLSQHSLDCFEAMGFDVTHSTQDEEQSLFTIKIKMPIPMLVYGDSFQWAKYGHLILPSNLDLINHNKAGLHQTSWNFHIEFLCTDLDGNLSSTLNPLTASKLDHYVSTFFEGLSETANKVKIFDQHMLHEKSKHQFIKDIGDIALFATQTPLPIFTDLFHQRFQKHSMLESMLEILQQFYIQMEIEPDEFAIFRGDLSTYTLRFIRCGEPATLAGSNGETLLDAPTAMLYH